MTATQVIWAASYPGSGSVKFRLTAHALVSGVPQRSSDLFMFRSCGTLPLQIGPRDDIERELLFTHLTPDADGMAAFSSVAIVLIVRHPVDVVFSCARYQLRREPDAHSWSNGKRAQFLRSMVEEFFDLGTLKDFSDWGFGTLASSIESWQSYAADNRLPLLELRFEDLRDRPVETATRIAAFFGEDAGEDTISDMVEAGRRDHSAELERRDYEGEPPGGYFYVPALVANFASGIGFHGDGASGYGKGQLSEAQWRRARDLFAPIASRYGYSLTGE